MVPCLDAGLDLIKEVHIGVPCEDHAAGAVGDAFIWLCGNVVKELGGGS